ncbi:PrsW family intramembrane metalloprotease [Sphingosinicella sp.]|uniref:PrsW family intramembrane metalloprotease n=1 Tax=Sphingosinicella sp. TaxID=1917971 RepID=UPI004037E29D
MADPNRPFVPPVPRDHDDATFSEMVPFRSKKIKLFKSPLFLLAVLAAVLAPFMFSLFNAMLTARSAQDALNAMITSNIIAVFFIVLMFQLMFYLYVRPSRSIWVYLIPFVVVALMVYFPFILGLFILVFREILPGDVSSILQGNQQPSFVPLFIAMFFGAGLMEELLKAVPILFGAWLAVRAIKDPSKAQGGFYNLLHVRGPLDGALMGVFAGGGFILIETAFQYVPNMVATIYQASNDLGAAMTGALLLLLPRVFGGIVGHMAYSGIFGYFIGLAVIRPKQRWRLLLIGYLSAALIHTLWNSVGTISFALQYVIAGVAAVGLVGAVLKARQLEASRSGMSAETMGSIVVERPGAPHAAPMPMAPAMAPAPQPVAAPAPPVQPTAPPQATTPPVTTPPPQAAPDAAAPAEVLMLNIDGMMLPLRAGGRLDLAAEPALGGRGAGILGSIIPHPTRANVLGLKNEGATGWKAKLRDGSMQMIEREQSIRLAAGVEISFVDGLRGAVVKLG